MPAARYWKLTSIDTYGNNLNLSVIWLVDSLLQRVDTSSTITSSFAPLSGAVTNLKDVTPGTGCSFSLVDIVNKNLSINWDAGSGNTMDVSSLRFGSKNTKESFIKSFLLFYSNDNINWNFYSDVFINKELNYPGANTLSDLFTDSINITSYDTTSFDKVNNNNFVANKSYDYNKCFYTSDIIYTGEHYFEITSNVDTFMVGFYNEDIELINNYPGAVVGSFGFYPRDGSLYIDGGIVNISAPYTTPGTIGILVSFKDNYVKYLVDGVLETTTIDLTNRRLRLVIGCGTTGSLGDEFTINTGQSLFVNAVPAGLNSGLFKNYSITDLLPVTTTLYDYKKLSNNIDVSGIDTEIDYFKWPTQGFDIFNYGFGFIKNTVKITGSPNIPVRRLVQLQDIRSGVIIRETWSDETTGEYEFKYLPENVKYNVIAIDFTNNFRSEINGPITPSRMPGY